LGDESFSEFKKQLGNMRKAKVYPSDEQYQKELRVINIFTERMRNGGGSR
jgi:hypothetical protein